MTITKQIPGYRQVQRKDMKRKIRLVNDLDYAAPYERSAQAHAAAHRAFVDWKAVGRNMGRKKFHAAPAITIDRVGQVVVVVDDGSLTLQSGELNYPAVWDRVRGVYGDQFDFLTFFADFPVPFTYSFWSPIFFATQGISPYSPTDNRNDWTTTRLQGFHFINPGHVNLMGVYLQEFGHQWGSYVYYADSPDSEFVFADLLLDGEPGHWDFFLDDGHSPMNYDFLFTPYMSTHWEQDGPSTFAYHATEGIRYRVRLLRTGLMQYFDFGKRSPQETTDIVTAKLGTDDEDKFAKSFVEARTTVKTFLAPKLNL